MYNCDPTVDYPIHNAALCVMATCHSLRKVNGDLLGDPLDIKMFEFTHWTFEESGQLPSTSRNGETVSVPSSVARSPMGTGVYNNESLMNVGFHSCQLD